MPQDAYVLRGDTSSLKLFYGDVYVHYRWHRRCIRIGFLRAPVKISGEDRVRRIRLVHNRLDGAPQRQCVVPTESFVDLDCGLVIGSTGFRGQPLLGLPFDAATGTIPNIDGRLVDGGAVVPGIYVAGWIKRGPFGVIGTNKADATKTVDAVRRTGTRSCARSQCPLPAPCRSLASRDVRVTSYDDWLSIDQQEVERDKSAGKPREKFTRTPEMLEVVHATATATSRG
jgi:ferredoxin--NADP+ reductase